MTTRRPPPDDRPSGNGYGRLPAGVPGPGQDPFDAQRARLAAFWALVLRRFRAYAHGGGETAADQNGRQEGG
jgi:hypothetical protein